MTTEKICFRYDGSDEAIEAMKWVNETFKKQYLGEHHHYYYNYLLSDNTAFDVKDKEEARLVTPAEFLRIVKGESDKPHFIIGGKCTIPYGVNGAREVATIVAFHAEWAWVLVGIRQYFSIPVYQLRPIRKSVREELHEFIKDAYNCFIPDNGIERIIELVKERKDEL